MLAFAFKNFAELTRTPAMTLAVSMGTLVFCVLSNATSCSASSGYLPSQPADQPRCSSSGTNEVAARLSESLERSRCCGPG